jgi:hypothetical protein
VEISENQAPIVILTSGQTLMIKQVQLFDAVVVRELATLQAEFTKLIGYQPGGYGFGGSATWVAGGMIAAGLLGALASAGARQKAQEVFEKIGAKQNELKMTGKFFHHDVIENIGLPNPLIWSSSEILTIKERKKIAPPPTFVGIFIKTDEMQGAEFSYEKINSYVLNDSEMIRIMSNIGMIDFRWSQIVAFRPVQ